MGRPVGFMIAPGIWYQLALVKGKLQFLYANGPSDEAISIQELNRTIFVHYPNGEVEKFSLEKQREKSNQVSANVVLDLGLCVIIIRLFRQVLKTD